MKKILTIVLLSSVLVGCSTTPDGDYNNNSTLAGYLLMKSIQQTTGANAQMYQQINQQQLKNMQDQINFRSQQRQNWELNNTRNWNNGY